MQVVVIFKYLEYTLLNMWQVFIDVSGQAPGNIYIGMLLIDAQRKGEILRDLYAKFPRQKSFDQKSIRIDEDVLFEILRFLDSKGIRMGCYHFKDFQWKKHEKLLNDLIKDQNSKHVYKTSFYRFNEKIMGILYFYLAQQIILNKNHHYELIACHETNIDIWEVFRTIQKLSKHYGYYLNPSANIRKIEHLLKLADYVAGANRKLEDFQLNTISRHVLLRDPIKDYDLKKIFNVYSSSKK